MAFLERISHTKIRYHRNPYCPLYVVGDYDCAVSGLAVLVRYMLVWIQQNATYPAAWVLSARLGAAAAIISVFSVGQCINMAQLEAARKLGRLFSRGLLIALFATTVIMTRRAIKVEGAASDWIADIEAEAQAKEILA